MQQITSIQSVGQCKEQPATQTVGMLTIGQDMAYFTTQDASYDVIASSVQVKKALSSHRGTFLAELTGEPYPRQTGGTGFDTTAIAIKQPMKDFAGEFSRPHGPGSMWSMTIDGTTYELHPKTDRAKLMLDQAGELNMGAAIGVMKDDAIEVWDVSVPLFKQPYQPSPKQAMQSADPAQQQSSFVCVGQKR